MYQSNGMSCSMVFNRTKVAPKIEKIEPFGNMIVQKEEE